VDKLYGKKGRIVAFRLGGGQVPKRPELPSPEAEPPQTFLTDGGTPEQLSNGQSLYERHCAICHSQGRAPDLTRMSAETSGEFSDIVLKGSRSKRGMGNFSQLLSPANANDILSYIDSLKLLEYQKGQGNTVSQPQAVASDQAGKVAEEKE